MSKMDRQSSTSGAESTSVPLACVPCRERHVKCDGLSPCCSRCYDSKQTCFYVRSRRGRRPSHNKRQRSADSAGEVALSRRRSSTLTVPEAVDMSAPMGTYAPRMHSPNFSPPPMMQSSPMPPSFPGTPNQRSMSHSPAPSSQRIPHANVLNTGPSPSHLTELYYFYFHDSHPIMVPQLLLSQIYPSMVPPAVEAAMLYVGAQYSSVARHDPQYFQRLHNTLFTGTADRSAFTVQALVLLGITQRAQDRNDLAYETFGMATEIATEIGMNHAAFAHDNNQGSLVLEEMWRRVWWELYVNDALLAATRQDESFRMYDVETDVCLPCEEADYRACNPGLPHSLNELTELAFYDDTPTFSSFTYRISAARNLQLLLKLNQVEFADHADSVTSLELALNNWLLYLPESKTMPLDNESRVDQMMYQAHLTANFTAICLHRPRSSLIFETLRDATTFSSTTSLPNVTASQIVHKAKAIEAADRISNLIALPGDVQKHSPLFPVMVAMSSLVHLSAYVQSMEAENTALIRDRLALSVGALKNVSAIWPLGTGVLEILRAATREVMTASRGDVGTSAANSVRMVGVRSSSGQSGQSQQQQPPPPQVLTSHHGGGLEYDAPVSMAADTWMTTMQDPIFAQIPELDNAMLPTTLGAQIAATYAG